MSKMNRMHVAGNPYQGESKRVLCVCSAGVLRSPTAMWVLGNEPFNFNTRCAGIEEDYALIPVDEVLLHWADEVVCMTKEHEMMLRAKFSEGQLPDVIRVLDISDDYPYKDKTLIKLIGKRYQDSLMVHP